jgi:hypothetical protein
MLRDDALMWVWDRIQSHEYCRVANGRLGGDGKQHFANIAHILIRKMFHFHISQFAHFQIKNPIFAVPNH